MGSFRRTLLAVSIIAGLAPLNQAHAQQAATPNVERGVLDATAPQKVIARFERGVPDALRSIAGLDVHYAFESTPAVYATATPAAARALSNLPGLAYLEADKPLVLALDTATAASRARHVFDAAYASSKGETPILDGSGAAIDGRGVGIAIVDSGLDGTHPDFAVPGKVGANFIVTPAGFTAATYTNLAQAHGTHVAGIAAGNGLSSGGVNRGAAPGATLYAFGVGPAGTIAFASMAFDWILRNGAKQNPPIKVVSNSWGCGGAACVTFNPYQVHNYLASQLADSGRVVTFAAGNDGGKGWVSTVNAEANNPTPGIIGVANYNDADSGRRELCISSSSSANSSRGASADARTWPDVSAPGTKITSTWPIGPDQNTRVPDGSRNYYRDLSGTSMATPHVAGVAALMLQNNPNLSPADVEYILKSTASKLTIAPQSCWTARPRTPYLNADPSHPYDGSNFESGHGLIDGYEAVDIAGSFGSIPAPPVVEPIPLSFIVTEESVAVTETLYLTPDGGMSPTFPLAPSGAPAQPLLTDTPIPFTTEPFAQARSIDGFTVDAWIGFTGELCKATVTPWQPRVDLERVPATGPPIKIAAARLSQVFICPMAPYERDFIFALDDPVEFEAGDRLRVSIQIFLYNPAPIPPEAQPAGNGLLYLDNALTPSRIGLGDAVDYPAPGSTEECKVRMDCMDLSETVPSGGVLCGGTSPFALEWFGPPGTGIGVSCTTVAASCVVPGLPTDPPGRCTAESVYKGVLDHDYGYCFTIGAPGPGGRGRCTSIKFIEDDRQTAL